MKSKTPVMLMILDGWGINPNKKGNAVMLAKTPCLERLFKDYPNTRLKCSGKAVGLPDGVMGNSEVGHLNIGAGRVVYQGIMRINNSIKEGSFAENLAFKKLIAKIKKSSGALHLMGLLSDGAVHSHIDHVFALLDMAKHAGLSRVYVHPILDGRDTPPDSGQYYIKNLQNYLDKISFGSIASICGRYYAMDRDKRWDRVKKAFELYTQAKGTCQSDPIKAVKNAYEQGQSDEFICPIVLTNNDNHAVKIENNDGVIFFNFRADRAREITQAFTQSNFDFFERKLCPSLAGYVCMSLYDESFDLPVAFEPIHLKNILGEILSQKGIRQLRIAETEKYAHVTYFFNGGQEKPFEFEDRKLIPSPRQVATYDLKPEMSAIEVTSEVIKAIESEKYDFIVLNFANMDMVGHTGVLEAAIKACESVDGCVEKILNGLLEKNGTALIMADHGNAEKMIDENGKIHTAHTTHDVPLILVDKAQKNAKLKSGILGDVAPTILDLMGIKNAPEMTGQSLLQKK